MMGRRRKCCCRDCSNVPGLQYNLLSVSTLEDQGYGMLFRNEHVFLYSVRAGSVGIMLIGDQKDRLYIVRGELMYMESGWLSTSEEERETARVRCV